MSLAFSISLLAAIAAPAAAQTFTSCNPLNGTCPSDTALGIKNATYNFQDSSAGSTWNTTDGTVTYGLNGAEFTIKNKGDAPTIQTNFYIFFGEVEVWLKAASGKGVVSSIVLESDDLDEIDWEFIGSNTTDAETNYYGKGNTTGANDRVKWHPMASPQNDFHNYTTRWTNETLEWFIDGNLTRTVAYADANGGAIYPQTPMHVKMGIWPAGDASTNANWTVDWAGGEIDYTKGPYTMYVQKARITDYSTGAEYQYGDKTGSWQSIDIVPGNSTAAKTLSAPPSKTLAQRWSGLSAGAKIGIYASIGAVLALSAVALAFYCIRQRRLGRAEHALAEATYEKETAELMAYRSRMGSGVRYRDEGAGAPF